MHPTWHSAAWLKGELKTLLAEGFPRCAMQAWRLRTVYQYPFKVIAEELGMTLAGAFRAVARTNAAFAARFAEMFPGLVGAL